MIKAIRPPVKEKDKTFTRPCFSLCAGPHVMDLGRQTRLMGIVNTTPDSFSGDGCLRLNFNERSATDRAVARARKLIREGADIIDLGGESSRPGAGRISAQEEILRVVPAVRRLVNNVHIPISVDTYKPLVARHALDAGAVFINNINGVKADKGLLKMVRNYRAAVILMHMQGTPRTMQKKISYQNLIGEILLSLKKAVENCLDIGIGLDKIVIDPGICFGKSTEHNLEILHRLRDFSALGRPVMIGTSRKSFIGKILDRDVKHRLTGTLATVCAAIFNGAHIVRVHDVKAAREAAIMTDAILQASGNTMHTETRRTTS